MRGLLRVTGLSVSFPGVLACDRVDLDLRPGEVHAVVGENGAGKSTLMHALVGLVQPSAGRMEVEGRPLAFGAPNLSRAAGISMVFQRFRLVPTLTVAQNVILGLDTEPRWCSPHRINTKIQKEIDRLKLQLDASALVADLSEGARQQVEILRVMYRGARILILDEPTSVLAPEETDRLLSWIRGQAEAGVGVFIISHKIPEVLRVADRITVMRRGRVVERDVAAGTCSHEELSRLMVGADAPAPVAVPAASPAPARDLQAGPLLELSRVTSRPSGLREQLLDVDLQVHGGEILGIAGVSGNGQGLLARVAAGLVRPEQGRVLIREQDLTGRGPRAFLEAGVRYAPEDRDNLAVCPDLSILDNGLLRAYRSPRVTGRAGFRPSAARDFVQGLVDAADVRTPGLDLRAGALSGGNLQKLIMAREMDGSPGILIAAQPTQGLDVAATARIRDLLSQLRARGVAVLLVSSDLDEILALADRIGVLYQGRLLDAGRSGDRALVGSLMTRGETALPRAPGGAA